MTNTSDAETFLGRDWGDAWDSLPEAPPLVPRQKTAQITLRLPLRLVADAKRIGTLRRIPYHVLVRGWILDPRFDVAPSDDHEPLSSQLNIKLTHEQLDELKRSASRLRRPYHRLARDRIQAAIDRERSAFGAASSGRRPSLQELMVLLLHQPGRAAGDAIHGITRLQKLLFVLERELGSGNAFYAYKYGPFSSEVLDAVNALRIAGFVGTPRSAMQPSFAEMVAHVERRAGPRSDELEEFALTEEGHQAAERLRRQNTSFETLYESVAQLRSRWDLRSLDELVERVYEQYPEYAEKSLIREEVAERAEKRKRDR